MRKLLFNKKNDVGAIGIGAMIVLIAMILVAGIAASVIISTANTLQSQALSTGSQTIKEVSSGIDVYTVDGQVSMNGTTYENITCLAVTVEGRPGSGRIDLNNTFILISDGSTKALLSYAYNESIFFNTAVTDDLFAAVTWENLSVDKFAVGVLQDYDGSMTRYNPAMNRGDKAVLYIYMNTSHTLNTPLTTRTDMFGQVIPEIGAPGVISFTSPMAYTQQVYTLQ